MNSINENAPLAGGADSMQTKLFLNLSDCNSKKSILQCQAETIKEHPFFDYPILFRTPYKNRPWDITALTAKLTAVNDCMLSEYFPEGCLLPDGTFAVKDGVYIWEDGELFNFSDGYHCYYPVYIAEQFGISVTTANILLLANDFLKWGNEESRDLLNDIGGWFSLYYPNSYFGNSTESKTEKRYCKTDLIPLKKKLKEYLHLKNVKYDSRLKTYQCPLHEDNHPSATLYDKQLSPVLWCPVCNISMDIFNVCGALTGISDFRMQLADVKRALGVI